MNIFDLDHIASVLMDVAQMVGTIVGVVGLTAVFVVFGLRIADARALEAARDAVSATRKRSQIAGEPSDTPGGVPAPPPEGPTPGSVDAGGPYGGAESEFGTPEMPNPRVLVSNVPGMALSSPVPDDASELDDDPDPDGPFGVAVPVG